MNTHETVRAALTRAYGPDWTTKLSYLLDVTKRSWFTYITDSNGRQHHEWHETECVVINHTEGRNVWGYDDSVNVSNYRALRESWADVDGLTDGPYSGQSFISLDLDKPSPADLIDVLESLEQYPVLDEQLWSDVEQEMIHEHWTSYGLTDALDKLADLFDVGRADLTDYATELVTALAFDGITDYGCGGGYPSFIDVSAVDFGLTENTEWIRERLGQNVTVNSRGGYGDSVTFDLTRSALVNQAAE